MAKVSIIVRTKNEERWIAHCLRAIFQQSEKDLEVILVDNQSTDATVEIASRFPIAKTVLIEKFLPGQAINEGIRASTGEYIVCISAHCVPKDPSWLAHLLKHFDGKEKIAGVYGRQIPTSFTDPVDKRDLLMVFGLDRRIQVKDYFFHNANSIFPRSVWEKVPFDETVTNIEDRVWGKKMIELGYKIIYEPDACVFHYHGLHQGNAPKRAQGVVSIIEKLDSEFTQEIPESWTPENITVHAVVPVPRRFDPKNATEIKNLNQTLQYLRSSQCLNHIYLLAHDEKLAQSLDCKWLDRSKISNESTLSLNDLLKESLALIEGQKEYPEHLIFVGHDYAYRPEASVSLIDQLIRDAQYKGLETVFCAYEDYAHYWIKSENGDYRETDASLASRENRDPIFRALYGQGCLTSARVLRQGKLVGGKVGIVPLKDFKFTIREKSL